MDSSSVAHNSKDHHPGDLACEILAQGEADARALADALTEDCASYRGLTYAALAYVHDLQRDLQRSKETNVRLHENARQLRKRIDQLTAENETLRSELTSCLRRRAA